MLPLAVGNCFRGNCLTNSRPQYKQDRSNSHVHSSHFYSYIYLASALEPLVETISGAAILVNDLITTSLSAYVCMYMAGLEEVIIQRSQQCVGATYTNDGTLSLRTGVRPKPPGYYWRWPSKR